MYAYILALIALGYLVLAYLPFSRLMFLQTYQTLLDINQAFYQLIYFTLPLILLGAILLLVSIKAIRSNTKDHKGAAGKAFSAAAFCSLAGIISSLLALTFSAAYCFGLLNYFAAPAPWTADELDKLAVHEAGHAVMREIEFPNSTVQAEIIETHVISNSQGWFLQPLPGGYVMGSRESRFLTKEDIEKSIRIYLAGLVSEKMIYAEEGLSTGAQDDLERVQQLIINMCNNGLSPLGPVPWEVLTEAERSALYQELVQQQAVLVEEKLQANKQSVIAVAKELAENKFLTGDEIRTIIANTEDSRN
ncbi:hypothetical protein [Desulfofalx alkaliphila]|uniref:hypothetical protein n=1 Tax=Desulfofalx alkaliphila TaxID=105483 RepID=UPI0004E1D053|nr:hypothetical protein [Desulfofalx alkaliphila]